MDKCSKCEAEDCKDLKKCTGCYQVSYCSRKCQSDHWRHHKTQCKPYKLTALGGKGLGYVATRKIKKGELLLKEEPILIRQITDTNKTSLPSQQFHSLSNSVQGDVFSLHIKDPLTEIPFTEFDSDAQNDIMESVGDDCNSSLGSKMLEGIFNSNGIWMRYNSSGGSDCGLYLSFSRLNHSCLPNLVCTNSNERGVMEVRTIRTIAPGEELCVNYIQGYEDFLTSEQRLARLSREWRFDCVCDLCQDAEESDSRRQELLTLHSSLRSLMERGNIQEALRTAEMKLSLMKDHEQEFAPMIPYVMIDVYLISRCGKLHGLTMPDYSQYLRDSLKIAESMGEDHVKKLKQKMDVKIKSSFIC